MHHGWHGTRGYDIQVLVIHVSTWVRQYSSLLQWSVPLGQQGHMAMALCLLYTKCTLHSNHRLIRVLFQHTKWLLPQSGHFLITYTHIAWQQKCELWRKTNYWEKTFLSCSLYLYRFCKCMSYGFPIIIFCNPRIHYETPCIICQRVKIIKPMDTWTWWS